MAIFNSFLYVYQRVTSYRCCSSYIYHPTWPTKKTHVAPANRILLIQLACADQWSRTYWAGTPVKKKKCLLFSHDYPLAHH